MIFEEANNFNGTDSYEQLGTRRERIKVFLCSEYAKYITIFMLMAELCSL